MTRHSRKRFQRDAPDGQRSSKGSRRGQAQSNNSRVARRPRPVQGQESSRQSNRPQGNAPSSNVTAQHPLPNPLPHPHGPSSAESDRGYRPPLPNPEPFDGDYNLRTHALSTMGQSQPFHDRWAGHESYSNPMMSHATERFHECSSTNTSQGYPPPGYRQRTPEFSRHQPAYQPSYQQPDLTQQPLREDRVFVAHRPVHHVLEGRARSMSPPIAETLRSTGNTVPAAAALINSAGDPGPVHSGDDPRSITKCGNCKREGHEVKHCVSKIGRWGYVMACPRCNSSKHLYDRCPSPYVPAAGTREREEDDLYYLLTCRQNKPQISSNVDLAALVRWATPSLAAFPWTAAFAMHYHEDPQQAVAERDYDYSKYGFGPAGCRSDREALTRKFDPSHPIIPKVPVPTLLAAPPVMVQREDEGLQGVRPRGDTTLIDSALNDVKSRAEAMRASSGELTARQMSHFTSGRPLFTDRASQGTDSNGSVTVNWQQQQPETSLDSTSTTPVTKLTPDSVWPSSHGLNHHKAGLSAPASCEDGEIQEDVRTDDIGASTKAAAAPARYGEYVGTWEAFVTAEIGRMERERALKNTSAKQEHNA
ncbi:hypothetical protein PG990_002290 [Apiospora arundinis]